MKWLWTSGKELALLRPPDVLMLVPYRYWVLRVFHFKVSLLYFLNVYHMVICMLTH